MRVLGLMALLGGAAGAVALALGLVARAAPAGLSLASAAAVGRDPGRSSDAPPAPLQPLAVAPAATGGLGGHAPLGVAQPAGGERVDGSPGLPRGPGAEADPAIARVQPPLRGRVLLPDGRPAGGATVALFATGEFQLDRHWRWVRDAAARLRKNDRAETLAVVAAASDGWFRFGARPAGRLVVVAVTPYLHAFTALGPADGVDTALELRMPEPPQAALSGVVRGADGALLHDARVTVGWVEGPALEAFTAADGTFSAMRVFPYGDGAPVVRITCGAEGYDTVTLELHAFDGDYVRLAHAGGEVDDYDLRPLARDTYELSITLARPTAAEAEDAAGEAPDEAEPGSGK